MASAMTATPRCLWLTVPIALLVALVSIIGWRVPDFYRGALVWTVQAVAQDIADLFVMLPIFVVSAAAAARGSRRAWLVWLGALTEAARLRAIETRDMVEW